MIGRIGARRGRPWALAAAAVILVGLVAPFERAAAAGVVEVAAFTCPPGTPSSTSEADLIANCPEEPANVTFALSVNGVPRRRDASPGAPAAWATVAGRFELSIVSWPAEPAVVSCNRDGTDARYDAPAGMISDDLGTSVRFACRWYRLPPAAVESPVPTPAPEPTPEAPPPTPAPTAGSEGDGELIDIGGRSLYLTCRGQGDPTIVLEAGGPGGGSVRWESIQETLSERLRVCSYDRAGVGQSDPPPDGVRTLQDAVNDLRALIDASALGCPCVFVGESWGGNIVRMFAGQYPGDVVGLVVVDSAPPGFLDRFLELVAEDEPGYAALMGSDNLERVDQLASLRQAEAASPPPPVPAVVVAHGLLLGFPLNFPVDQLEATWRSGQESLARSFHARFLVADLSGNSILRDQPEIVVGAVEEVAAVVKDPASLRTALVVRRLNANGRPVLGACFQLWADAGDGTRGPFRDGKCDREGDGAENGVIVFPPQPPGSYILQEVTPPEGESALPDQTVALYGLATDVIAQSAG